MNTIRKHSNYRTGMNRGLELSDQYEMRIEQYCVTSYIISTTVSSFLIKNNTFLHCLVKSIWEFLQQELDQPEDWIQTLVTSSESSRPLVQMPGRVTSYLKMNSVVFEMSGNVKASPVQPFAAISLLVRRRTNF